MVGQTPIIKIGVMPSFSRGQKETPGSPSVLFFVCLLKYLYLKIPTSKIRLGVMGTPGRSISRTRRGEDPGGRHPVGQRQLQQRPRSTLLSRAMGQNPDLSKTCPGKWSASFYVWLFSFILSFVLTKKLNTPLYIYINIKYCNIQQYCNIHKLQPATAA